MKIKFYDYEVNLIQYSLSRADCVMDGAAGLGRKIDNAIRDESARDDYVFSLEKIVSLDSDEISMLIRSLDTTAGIFRGTDKIVVPALRHKLCEALRTSNAIKPHPGVAPYSAQLIASYAINSGIRQGVPLQGCSLSKILYLIQGIGSQTEQHRCIQEDFYAWDTGPQIPSMHSLSVLRITNPVDEFIDFDAQIDEGARELIDGVVHFFGNSSFPALCDLCRDEAWKKAHDNEKFSAGAVIPYEDIKKNFSFIGEMIDE